MLIQLPADIAIVGAGEDLRLGEAVEAARLLDQPDKRLLAVHAPVDLPEILIGQRLLQEDVRGRQNAAHRLDTSHGEADLRPLPIHGQLLEDLGRMPVAGRLE